ncbi:MAG: phage major capsid protein [Prevotellaceae bacterium]|nr:phage major capsid protein [Candidatus Faecinaster equi]
MNEILERKSAISAEIETEVSEARLIALKAEAIELMKEENAIKERAKAIEAEEARVLDMAKNADEIKLPNTEKETIKMTDLEMRSSKEYAAAWLKGVKTNDYAEARSLLTTAASGSVPVPTFLEEEIKTAWEENNILNLCKKSFYKGNFKVGFEYSADDAVYHNEGDDAPDEESIVIGTVEIANKMVKKWITVSDEAIEGTTVDTMGYLLKEIAHKIAFFVEATILVEIQGAPTTATTTAVGVPEIKTNLAVDTIVKAVAKLSGQARNLSLVMNRGTYAELVSAALNANYAVDVFDGLKDRIIFTDALPAYGDADADSTYIIVGDFGYGVQCNLPNGDGITIKVDDASLAEKDLVKIVGRQYVGIGVVADRAFVRIAKVAG